MYVISLRDKTAPRQEPKKMWWDLVDMLMWRIKGVKKNIITISKFEKIIG